MARRRARKRRGRRRPDVLHKPRGVIHPRVQRVGPEHFGIVSVDCAKARSKWMLADYYGNVLLPATIVEHTRGSLEQAVRTLREAIAQHEIRDVLVAVERTGRYHHPVKRAFSAAGFETRVVHPFTTKQFRQAADPGVKTDDTDLAAIHRASVNGFALAEASRGPLWRQLQLLTRHRRDWVRKVTTLRCQIKEHLHAAMPGYAATFRDVWKCRAAIALALRFGSAEAMRTAGIDGMIAHLREAGIRFQRRTVQGAFEWARNAAAGEGDGEVHCRIASELNDDRVQKEQQVQGFERQIAADLVRTPYVLLLSVPGINVVSAGEFAGEAGPIEHYANSRCITGRAGLYPSRYQSDQVDHPNGPLVKCANRRLRHAILQIADNLLTCNHHFRILAARWRAGGADPRLIRVRIGQRFSRIAFQLVAGRRVFAHPCLQERHYILLKLMRFHQEHETSPEPMRRDLHLATEHLPICEYLPEAEPLEEQLQKARSPRGGSMMLAQVLPTVLAKLRGQAVQSGESGPKDPT